MLHSGNSDLTTSKVGKVTYLRVVKSKEKRMLRQLFKSMVVARQAAAAIETLKHMSDRQLEDIGFTRATYVEQIKASVLAELVGRYPNTRNLGETGIFEDLMFKYKVQSRSIGFDEINTIRKEFYDILSTFGSHISYIDKQASLGTFPTLVSLAPALVYALMFGVVRMVLHHLLFKVRVRCIVIDFFGPISPHATPETYFSSSSYLPFKFLPLSFAL